MDPEPAGGRAPSPLPRIPADQDGEAPVELRGAPLPSPGEGWIGGLPPSCRGCPLLVAWPRLGGLGAEVERLVDMLVDEAEAAMLRRAASRVVSSMPVPVTSGGAEPLTPRQEEVRELLAQGKPDREIARRLNVKPNTARSYAADVLAKLGVHSRRDLR